MTAAAPGSTEWWDQLGRSSPPARGRPAVPIARIVDAGLSLLDESEATEFSIRNVANRLGSGTATLYRRVGGRPGLDALVVDAVLGEALSARADVVSSTWQEACIEDASAIFEALVQHPRAAPLLAAQVPAGPRASELRERFLRHLLDAGFEAHVAARAYTTVGHYIVGFALQIHSDARQSSTPTLPATVLVAPFLHATLREEFRFGLEMIVAGLSLLRDDG